jgi:protein gp37
VGDKSSIEWLDGGATWNPTRGCTPCAPECARCYARTFAERWRGIPGHAYEQGFDPRTVPDALDLPLRWTKPRTIFVNSMSDLFHEAFPDAYVLQVIDVIRSCLSLRGHRFILLTKRAARMRDFLARLRWDSDGEGRLWLSDRHATPAGFAPRGDGYALARSLTNLTVGVSVGTLDRRGDIDDLRATPAAGRMVSFEPLLEDLGDVDLRGIDVAAIGGESGPGARPCDVAWIRSLVARCRTFGAHAFVKQLGAMPVMPELTWREMSARGPAPLIGPGAPAGLVRLALRDRKGADPQEWPSDLRVRELPNGR